MDSRKIRLAIICLLANVILAGFIVQAGLLTGAISEAFEIDVIEATKYFSALYTGYMVGNVVVFFSLSRISIKFAMLVYCAGTAAAAVALHFASHLIMLPILFAILGTLGGASAGIAGTLISQNWQGKPQNTMFLAQDASFNLGGALYPLATALILTAGLAWTFSYLFVAAGVFVILILLLTTDIDGNADDNQRQSEKTVWNSGVITAGLALFLVITGKYFIIVWLPNFALTKFGASPQEAGELISSIFASALVGSIVGTLLVTKIRISTFIMSAVSMGCVSALMFTVVESLEFLLLTASIFGLAVSVLYNVFTAYGISFVSSATHQHIAYVLLCGGVAQSIAPYLSSLIADATSVDVVLITGALLYGVVVAVIAVTEHTRTVRV